LKKRHATWNPCSEGELSWDGQSKRFFERNAKLKGGKSYPTWGGNVVIRKGDKGPRNGKRVQRSRKGKGNTGRITLKYSLGKISTKFESYRDRKKAQG